MVELKSKRKISKKRKEKEKSPLLVIAMVVIGPLIMLNGDSLGDLFERFPILIPILIAVLLVLSSPKKEGVKVYLDETHMYVAENKEMNSIKRSEIEEVHLLDEAEPSLEVVFKAGAALDRVRFPVKGSRSEAEGMSEAEALRQELLGELS